MHLDCACTRTRLSPHTQTRLCNRLKHPRLFDCPYCRCRYGPAAYALLNGYATGVSHHVVYYKVLMNDPS